MAEILKEWLSQRLKVSIQWDATELGEKMKNGYIVACLLHDYKIINDDKQRLIRLSNQIEDIKNNWKLLCEWLRNIEIILNDDDLEKIMKGKASTILRLFYQLFLILDKKDRTDFIKEERKMASTLVNKSGNRFSVHKVYEDNESIPDDLSKPLFNEKHFIDWQRKKSEQVKEMYDFIRHKYSKKIHKLEESNKSLGPLGRRTKEMSEADKKDIKKFSLKYPCKFENFSYDELLALDDKATEKNKYIADSEWSKEYMKNLHSKMHKKSDSEEFQKHIIHSLSGILWNDSVADNESKLDLDLAKKVMKLAQFEKQMCTQIMETKQQGRNLVKNRFLAEKEFADERTNQFNVFLDSLKEDINSGLSEINFEKQRQQMLHKRLYAEKMKRKRQHYYEICYDTMLAIIDYASKYGYFKHLIGDDIPAHFIHEWKLLFFKQQPIFDIYTPIDDLVMEDGEEIGRVVEEVVDLKLEKFRQECLNETEFMEYHEYLMPWSLELLISNYDSDSEEKKYEQLGNRVLSHVVYTLLEIKYPYPPKRMSVDLPDFNTKALLVGLPNTFVATAIQKLLDARKIHVVRIESCVDFCLRQYKSEMLGSVDIEITFDKFMNNAKEENTKELIKQLKSNDELHDKSNELLLLPLTNNTKQTQTPNILPEDQLVLSNSAILGKYAYETLSSGNSLTSHLIVGMIEEYIKHQKYINGFVIINYPNAYFEAHILEEAFSGKTPPPENELDSKDDKYLEESIEKHYKREIDTLKEYRKSKILKDPHKSSVDEPFTSYFSCYIKLKKTEDIRKEIFIWQLTNENSELIDRFYAALGINYSMYYEVIEKEQLALICRYIIGDYEMPLKPDVELFGPDVLSNIDFPSSDEKRSKTKVLKVEPSITKYKDKRSSKAKISSNLPDLNSVKMPVSTVDLSKDSLQNTMNYSRSSFKVIRDIRSSKSVENENTVKLPAGDEDWKYSKIPIPEKIGIALATYWEKAENAYVMDVQQLLLSKRLQINCLVPYSTFIKDKMNQIIMLPSHKQDLVSEFQKQYNDFEDDWRDINVTKNEWHCRVKELQNKLYDICDERKKLAEQQKQSIICENWIVDELITLANTYISLIQTEMNRFVLSYQILHDFYFTMIKGLPPYNRLISKELHKIVKESDEMSSSKRGGEDKFYSQLKNVYLDLHLRNINIDNHNNPLIMVIENNVKFVLKTIKDLNDSYRSLIGHEYGEIAKTSAITKKKDGNALGNSDDSLETIKCDSFKCIEEWTMGINGEMFRANTRILALQKKCYEDMNLLSNHIFRTFAVIQDNINNYYMNEIKSVELLCKFLQMAIENGEKISENLILKDNTFIIDPNLVHFSAKGDVFSEKPYEMSIEMNFKIGQLAKLRNSFKIIAPFGIILQQSFIYALQDFVFFGKESCDGPLIPTFWKRIDPEQIPKLILSMFGENAFIDWRDFLIYCLNIPFPTLEELLETRKRFRCQDLESKEIISRDEFINIELWFENYIQPDNKILKLRNTLRKHFLFELFEISENVMNYSAFLLAFCKGIDPKEGFSKALSIAIGKKICYSLDDCGEVIQKYIQAKKCKDESLAHAHKFANTFLERVLANVLNECAGITILELENDVTNSNNVKKIKKSKRSNFKKTDSLPTLKSAKSPKKGMASPSKAVESETDLKVTCKPCEDYRPEAAQKEVLEKGDVKEIKKEDPLGDINLTYSVDQPTIWNVLRICLPWYFLLAPEDASPYKAQIEDLLMQLEQDTDDRSIYIANFLSDPNICKFLYKTKRFQEVNFYDELIKITVG